MTVAEFIESLNVKVPALVVVAGKNAALEKECRTLAAQLPVPVKVHGFVHNMHELMDAADLIVTKPGGLTTTEILAKGKPMALVAPIPGQEQRNCEYLLEEGAAVRLYDVGDAAHHLEKWLLDAPRMRAWPTPRGRSRDRRPRPTLPRRCSRAGVDPRRTAPIDRHSPPSPT